MIFILPQNEFLQFFLLRFFYVFFFIPVAKYNLLHELFFGSLLLEPLIVVFRYICLCISVSSKAHSLHIIHFNTYIFHPLVCFYCLDIKHMINTTIHKRIWTFIIENMRNIYIFFIWENPLH